MTKTVVRAADKIDVHVGGRVRLRRTMIRMSQEHLADALGLTFQQVQKYERGQNRIGAGRLYRIAQVLGVPVQFFYDGLPEAAGPAGPAAVDPERMLARGQSFLATPDGQSLTAAFLAIDDAATRRGLIDLVRTIADGRK